MSETEKLRPKIIVGVITTLIVATISYFAKSWWTPLIGFLSSALTATWTWLTTGHGIFGWHLALIILLAGAAIFGGCFAGYVYLTAYHWKNYRSDMFFGVNWRWHYMGSSINNPVPFCPQCDTQLVVEEKINFHGILSHVERTNYLCDHCGHPCGSQPETFSKTLERVIRQIDRKLRTNEWQNDTKTKQF